MRRLMILMGLLGFIMAACGAEGDQMIQNEPAEDTVIVMLGDSLTAGYGLPPSQALPAVLDNRLRANGHAVSVHNAGVSGDTTAMALARYRHSVSSHDADMLVIALGTNDFLFGFPASVARQNLSKIIERANSEGLDVVIAGIEPRWPEVYEMLQGEYASMFPHLAADYELPYYEGFMRGVWQESDLLLADGLHPNAEGVERMAERLAAFLEAELN
ncbi:arylesterase [Ponticaulis sp.]|uniref:arylesterase n=1 Tax=Ponticaulis sp. TaxID=2020902 RepID=UPI0025D0E178|nr:arylesterase [Ponticaulis sp.]